MTLDELSQLTPEQKRVKIAEACGWTIADTGNGFGSTRSPEGEIWNHFTGSVKVLPDYLSSLDAMHEAEKVLTKDQHRQYALATLPRIVGIGIVDIDGAVSATASQRADAFLLTLSSA